MFADFYGKLYSSLRIPAHSIPNLFGEEQVGDITREEVRAVFQKMRKGKAADKSGLTLEMFLHGSEDLVQMIAALFTAILRPNASPPKVWKENAVKVIFKKGDASLPENYRPICILPILYKVFSRVLLGRIGMKLDDAQTVEQADLDFPWMTIYSQLCQ